MLSHLVIGAILLGSAFSIFNQHDYWPFSHYPMFAELQSADLSMFEVVGIVAGESEIALTPSRRTAIVAGRRFQDALTLLLERGPIADLHEYLASLGRQYERRDARPTPLQSVRLYRSRWQAAPELWPPVRRIERTLITEIALTGE